MFLNFVMYLTIYYGNILQESVQITQEKQEEIPGSWFITLWRFTWWIYVQDAKQRGDYISSASTEKFHLVSLQIFWTRFAHLSYPYFYQWKCYISSLSLLIGGERKSIE